LAALNNANGFWFGALFLALMALTLSFNPGPQGGGKKHPRFFVREIRKGSSWKYPKKK
jgi:hypothetical protein